MAPLHVRARSTFVRMMHALWGTLNWVCLILNTANLASSPLGMGGYFQPCAGGCRTIEYAFSPPSLCPPLSPRFPEASSGATADENCARRLLSEIITCRSEAGSGRVWQAADAAASITLGLHTLGTTAEAAVAHTPFGSMCHRTMLYAM